MQFFSEENLDDEILCNIDIEFTSNMTDITSKKVLQIPESYRNVEQLNVHKTPLYAPYIKVDTTRYNDNGNYIKSEKYREIEWLQTACTSNCFVSWAKHYSDRNLEVMPLPELNAVLPIIPKKIHTVAIQYHFMKIIKRAVNFLNPGQTPTDTCDQPVYALTKEMQWRFPENFGPNSYFTLFGGLHFEQCMLVIHGELIKGSGLYEILKKKVFQL